MQIFRFFYHTDRALEGQKESNKNIFEKVLTDRISSYIKLRKNHAALTAGGTYETISLRIRMKKIYTQPFIMKTRF